MEQSQIALDTRSEAGATTSTTTTTSAATPDDDNGNTNAIPAKVVLTDNLLSDTLNNIWQNYLLAAEDVDAKRHLLQLFLYNFQFVNGEFLTQPQFKSFFHPIPEEICSFLLEQVYDIISQSNLFPTVHLNINNIEDVQNSAELLRRKHNFAQLILNGPSDCSKIVALRTYLTNELGQHLLQFLLKVDIKLIASLKSLCKLCFNLFPNCPWSAENLKAIDIQPTYTLITDNYNQRTKTKTPTTSRNATTFQLKFSSSLNDNQQSSISHVFGIQEDYEEFKCATKTSDEIAYILIKILAKCIETECDAKQLSSQSMSVMTLNFALDSLLVADKAFGQLHNTYVLKYELLQLIQKCLQNIFAKYEHINAIQFDILFAKLAAALEHRSGEEELALRGGESERGKGGYEGVEEVSEGRGDVSPTKRPTAATLNTARFHYALNFVVFNVIHNLVAAFSDRRQHILAGNQNNARQHLYTMKFMNEHVLETCVETLKQLLKHKQDAQIQMLCGSSFKMLIKIIENLNRYEQANISGGEGNSVVDKNVGILGNRPPPRRRKVYAAQKHCQTQTQKLCCYFQGILWELLPELCNEELQAYAMRYLLRAGTCCCHYTVDNFGVCLRVALQLEESQQKSAYKFLYRKLLNAIFVRQVGTPTKKKPALESCTKCDAKLKAKEFHTGILEMYKRQYEQLAQQSEIMPMLHYLKHLKHIAHLLSHDIAAGILAEIALPVFRQYKKEAINLQKPAIETDCEKVYWRRRSDTIHEKLETPKSSNSAPTTPHRPQLPPLQLQINSKSTTVVHADNLKVLYECLNIFIMYLSDIRLIKAFYNEENIKHLEDLLNEPELIRGICDLIKIGIDNITFLGDNSQEQLNLSQRLITLQLNSSDHAAQLFNALLARFGKGTRNGFWLDAQNTKVKTAESVQPLDILHSVAVQWSLNYELLKTSQYFYNEFAKIYSIVVEEQENEVPDVGIDERAKSPNRLQRGDKTIIDILKLNYNALSSFLLLPSRRKSGKSTTVEPDQNIYKFSTTTPTSSNTPTTPSKPTTPTKSNTSTKPIASLTPTTPTKSFTLNNESAIEKPTTPLHSPLTNNDSLNIIPTPIISKITFDSLHNEFDCLSSSIDLCSTPTTTTSSSPSLFSLANASVEGKNFVVLGCSHNCNELVTLADNALDYDTLSRLYDAQRNATEIQSYLQQQQNLNSLTTSVASTATTSSANSIVIYDVRNSRQCSSYLNGRTTLPDFKRSFFNCSVHAQSGNNNNNSNTSTSNLNLATSANDTLSTILSDPKTHERVGGDSNEGIIGKLFSVFGAFFGGGHANFLSGSGNYTKNKRNDSDENEIESDLLCFYDICGDGKKLLLNLFEATMAICIKGYQNEEAEKMQKHLRKLRAVILSNASKDWSQHGEEHHSRENLVLQTLQTLLKIAELSNTVNDPAAVVNNMTISVTSAGGGGGGGGGEASSDNETLPIVLSGRQRARSFNSPRSNLLPPLLTVRGAALRTPPTPQRPLSAESVELDYFSRRASTIRPDSEVELSENDNDNDDGYYQTADEGYEADGEIQEISDSDLESEVIELWHTFPPTSRYRTHVLHDGLSRLIVEILMELSQMCTRNPVGWSDNLAQLANRLFVIREHLGGPLFLLRGFKPVLECNDTRLRELQQSILELITDLSTPEVLCTYFNIMASRNPPMDILVKYMHYICAGSLKKIQPRIELEFPVIIDGKCISTSDPKISEQIDRVRNYHLLCQATTPFTRSPCIIPITHARLWNTNGFTISLWVQIKGSQAQKSTSQLNDEDTRSSRIEEENLKTHLVSIGSNQAMLSIYINSNMNLVFETFKPNAEIQVRLPHQHDDIGDVSHSTVINEDSTQETNHNNSHATSPFRNALKHTKLVLLNSFSNMHLFNGHPEGEPYFETSVVNLRYFRMLKNKWTQLTCAVAAQPDRLDLIIYIDGLEQHTISLPFNNLRNYIKAHTFQSILLGDGAPTKSLNNTSNYTESRSTIDGFPFRYSISNVILFNHKISNKELIVNLTAMGPDFTELTLCKVANSKPNYAYLNLTKMHNANFGNFVESMKLLKDMRILTYTAQQPEFVMGYDATLELDNATFGRPCGLILYGELVQNELTSLQTSAVLCGGLSTLVYLFARVVEVSSQSATQATALDILLNAALTDSQLYAEMIRNDFISLIGYVIKSDRCTKDTHLLRSIINSACSQPLIIKRGGESLHVNENTITSLIYPRLLASVLHRYADWHRSGADHSDVLDMLFASILALTREKHPHRDFNMEQLNKVGLLKDLLNLCKVYVIESPNPVYISKQAAESFVNILSVFAGSPPTPSLLDEIMKLLLLLHKPSECYITHDRNKFYFLLTPLPPTKSKTATNLSRVAAPFRRNFMRERPGVAVPVQPPINEMELKRMERINRLRRLHMRDSTYKRALNEFEENIENIADCSKLNKSALRLISPVEASKWRLKYKRQLPDSPKHGCSPSKLRKSNNSSSPRSVLSPQQKITHKRSRLQVTSSSSILRRRSANTDGQRNSAGNNMEQENMDDSFDNGSPTQRRNGKIITKTDFYNSVGMVTIQEGLFKLLKNFLCLMPDKAVEDVLKHYIKVEYLLVLSNHSSCAVRTAIIQLLAALTKRLPQIELTQCYKNFYPQHLANQLTTHSTDAHMFEALVEWISGFYGDSDKILGVNVLRIQNRFGLAALLANATKITSSNAEFAERAFLILHKFYVSNPDDQQLLLEAGLLQCCTKALYYCFSKVNFANMRTEQAILDFLTVIGEKSLKSVGHVNIIWDILNMLTYYQEQQPEFIVRNFRSVQAQLQFNWVNMFFVQTNVPWSYKINILPDSRLTLAESKTRLELLIDRCSQFFTVVYAANYTPSEHEIKLFELLVTYGISTNQRCNNFIAWGLQPSRPLDLRAFIVNALWILCQDDFVPTIICDGKMIKSLLWLCLLEDLEAPIPHLLELCHRLGIRENDSTWNLENELSRIELNRCTVSAKQKQLIEKTVYKMENLASSCIESSMSTTRRVTELQNAERKILIGHMKDYDETSTYTKWVEIIRRMTHEGAPWYCKERYETSWELDNTEGPSRVHTRLRRCHLDIDKRFIMEDYRPVAVADADTLNSFARSDEYTRPLEYLISTYDQQLNISLNSQILYNFPAKYLPVDGDIEGEIIVTDQKLWFLATYRCKYFYVNCDISNITEIWPKRYLHQEKAFEIFLDTNQSYFFSLQNQEDWKIMQEVFYDKIVTPPDSGKIQQITQQWRDGLLTNWEYLMTLNQIAGRTYNDLMQYPVFPWILSNYESDILDLTNSQNFRRLEKPIAIQHEESEAHYKYNYSYINNTVTNMGSLVLKPYHYSSHYSNTGTVLHFMVRVPPFTGFFLNFQDKKFDLPDRTFHILASAWKLASRDSTSDVKELIPEFFCLPEMFENFERFNFGCLQSGERVEDVTLPAWCQRDPRLFVLIHRQALESEVVRGNLHQWIDLIFGYKQTGDAAVEAINVFHPATYSDFLDSEIKDPLEREAVETMVQNYGQMPRQLFKWPHIISNQFNYCIGDKKILPTVCGLRWGVYLGSPQLPTPRLGNIHKLPDATQLVSFANTNVVYGLPAKACVMQGAEVDTFNVIYWGYVDRIVRILPLNKMYAKPKNFLHNTSFDDITACGSDPNSNQLWFGHKSGRISVYKCFADETRNRATKSRQSYVRGLRLSYNSAFRKMTTKSSAKTGESEVDGEMISSTHSTASVNSAELTQHDSADLIWQGPTVLVRHNDEITCISLSVEFKIAVTAGRDGIAVIWDLNNWSYVRTIEQPAEIHHSPITLIAISPTLGDIVTVHTIPAHTTSSGGNDGLQSNGETSNDPSCSADSKANFNTSFSAGAQIADECFEVTEENLDDFVNVAINPNGKSILRLHTGNARYVQHIVHEERILDVCYSYIKEGVGVNIIATAIEGGIVRLWSSWNLSFVSEIVTGISNIKSIIYSTHQHLVVLTKESHIQVWETDGLFGNSPKFPQIQYK